MAPATNNTSVSPAPAAPSALRTMLRSLAHRNFRLFFMGQSISLTGTWMQSVAMPWLVYKMTGSVVLLGVVGFTGQVLTFVLAPIAGVLADRWDRRRLILVAQAVAMAQAAALALLTLLGHIEVWHVVALSVFTGLVRGFEVPTRQSFVIQMLDDPADLPNAIALNSFLVNGARLVGPSLAGLIVAFAGSPDTTRGEGMVFAINAASYVAVIAGFAVMRVRPRRVTTPMRNLLHGLREGLAYAMRRPAIRGVLVILSVTSLAGVPYMTLMPVFAKEVLGGGPDTFGYMMGATGVGALAGAVFLASRKSVLGLGRMIRTAGVAFGLGLVAFSLTNNLWLALPALVWAGAAMMLQMACSNTLLQTLADEDTRGRIMSFYTMAFMGMIPFGALLAGWVAHHLGVPTTVLIGGIVTAVGSFVLGRGLPGVTAQPALRNGDEPPP
jgi:MFS family permease